MYYTEPAVAGEACTAGFKQDYEHPLLLLWSPAAAAVEPKRNQKTTARSQSQPPAVACDGSVSGASLRVPTSLSNAFLQTNASSEFFPAAFGCHFLSCLPSGNAAIKLSLMKIRSDTKE